MITESGVPYSAMQVIAVCRVSYILNDVRPVAFRTSCQGSLDVCYFRRPTQSTCLGFMKQASKTADVVILGGGPAGLATAIALRARGADCLVVEALAPGSDEAGIDKSCGEGLMPDALRSLERLGVKMTAQDGPPFRGIRFSNGHNRAQASFPRHFGLGVRRTHLHRLLIARAQRAGVRLAWNTHARLVDRCSLLLDGEPLHYRWLVGADGQSSSVRRWAGLDSTCSERMRFGFRRHYQVQPWSDFVEVHWGPMGQVYITPVAANCVCVAFVTRDMRFDRANYLAAYPELDARLRGAPLVSRERGAATATRKLRRVTAGNIALVGDASGSVDAVTGEGLAIAFHQAIALADAITEGNLAEYQQRHRALARLPHAMAQLLLTMDRWPSMQRRGLRTLEAQPELFRELLAVHVGDASLPRFAIARGPQLAWGLLQSPAH